MSLREGLARRRKLLHTRWGPDQGASGMFPVGERAGEETAESRACGVVGLVSRAAKEKDVGTEVDEGKAQGAVTGG